MFFKISQKIGIEKLFKTKQAVEKTDEDLIDPASVFSTACGFLEREIFIPVP
jgi:hypothetical protein